ncbi:MAG: MFS transporter [Pseudomonadota bacterium]
MALSGSDPVASAPTYGEAAPVPVASFAAMLGQTWPLLLGVGLLSVGSGLQATLLGVRAGIEGYSSELLGFLMAGYFAGFMAGAVWTPRAVKSVGQIRVFAALAAVGSIAILVQATVVDPTVWIVMRILSGFCFAGIYVIAEAWLNQASDNANRGRLLAAYMVVSFGGIVGGQALMVTASPETTSLFMVTSVLISIAAVPMLLTATQSPPPPETQTVLMLRLYRVSPLGAVGTFAAGLINGSVFGMAAIYAQARGLSIFEITLFVSIVILSGAALQYPVGRLSDIIDRRLAIGLTALVTCLSALVAALFADRSETAFLLAFAVVGGFSLSIHALSIAYTNDYLEPTELVGASSGLVLIMSMGAVVGPLVVGVLMGQFGPGSYPLWLAAIGAGLLVFTIFRMIRRESLPAEAQGPYVAVTPQASQVAVQWAEEYHSEEVQAELESDSESVDPDRKNN